MSFADEDRWDEEDAQWQAIVANYGERASLPPPEPAVDDPPHHSLRDVFRGLDPLAINQPPPDPTPDPWIDDGSFTPPLPPPVPRPRGWRLIAWLGVLGVPIGLVVIALVRVPLPSWGPVAAMVWFIGGFAYLITQRENSRDPHQGWDDGAVL